jgi:hypothetical protein
MGCPARRQLTFVSLPVEASEDIGELAAGRVIDM